MSIPPRAPVYPPRSESFIATSSLPVGAVISTPETREAQAAKYHAELLRGLQMMASGLGMVVTAYAKLHSLRI